MHVKLQLVMCSDDGHEETITDLVTLQKDSQRIEHLGLTLREAKRFCRKFSFEVICSMISPYDQR